MSQVVPTVLVAWVAVSLVLFWRLPGRDAALVCLIGGWAFLPVAPFPPNVFAEPVGTGGSMHALAVPTAILVNKATAIGLGCLAGSILFDWPAISAVRPTRLDLPMLVWCLTPIASALANGLPLAEGLAQSRYLGLAWGVPYLMGRAYLVDDASLYRLGLGLVMAGLLTGPLCLVEFVARPFLYGLFYGSHPYQTEGATRYVLYRPLLFFEHGNQLGMWVASVAVSAAWLWRSGRMPRLGGVPGALVAAGLVLVCLACQSLGGIVLTAVVLLPMMAAKSPRSWARPAAVGVVVLAGLVVAGGVALVGGNREKARGVARTVGKGSFTWRLGRYEENLPRLVERPILGRARADWSDKADGTFVDPVALGLWMPALGLYGFFGLFALTLTTTLPIVEVVRWLPARAWLNPACSAVTLAAVLLAMNVADAAANSVFLLPLMAGAGGLNSWSMRRYEGR